MLGAWAGLGFAMAGARPGRLETQAQAEAITMPAQEIQPPIDFDRAALTWTTKTGSHGRWRLAASATAWSRAKGPDELYVLAPMVGAGDVYGAGRLPRDPPYTFQVLASRRRHAIIREAATNTFVADSADGNDSLFESVDIHDPRHEGPQLVMADLVVDRIAHLWPLTCRVRARTRAGDDMEWLLDFPVNHINAKLASGVPLFQVETGPVLVPDALVSEPGASRNADFVLAYVFFNRLDRVDLSLAARSGTDGRRAFALFGRLNNVAIELFGSGGRR